MTHTISKTCAAVICALSMSASAANLVSADSMVAFSGDNMNQMMGLTANDNLKAGKVVALSNGVSKVRFQQYHQGIKVFGHSIAATQSEMGFYSNVQGNFLNLDMMSTKGRIAPEQALNTLIGDNSKGVYNQQSERVIYVVDGKPTLVNMVSFVRPGTENVDTSRPTAFIDANSGETVLQFNNLQHATGPGGNTKTGQYNYGTDFSEIAGTVNGSTCTHENSNVRTIDLNHGTSGGSVVSFTCPENTHKEINGAYSPANDAQYFGNVIFDMYNAYVGTNPLTFQLTMRVHYSNSYENAFWDGSAMTFGDGASTFFPLVSLDVSSHEVSHGFTEQNSNLVYSNMSGGMNEAFSDMAGEAAEFYMNGSNDWMVGEQIFKSTGALRYMDDPTRDGSSIGHADDFNSSMDVHYSSGVFNKAFYLLANTAGWSTQSAFEVMALANQTYWTANSTFDEGACGVYNATADKGYNQADVRTAFAAVGVNTCDAPPPPPPGVLVKGVAQTISGATGSETHWSYDATDANTVTFNMSGGTGDADMYVKLGSAPTSTTYDCRPYASGNTEACDFTAGGTYYVMVNGYSSYSGVTLLADHDGGTTPPPTGGDSGSDTNVDISKRGWSRYTVTIPAGSTNFTVSTTGGTGDADLYIREGANPTKRKYDCRSLTAGTNVETCTMANPAAGTYNIGIRANQDVTGVDMAWSYE
ncbi:MAG: vibriolysin [Phenylobacterium sp.]|jgi:vibriolysin